MISLSDLNLVDHRDLYCGFKSSNLIQILQNSVITLPAST